MTEHDNIKELFSKGLENHSSAVRPEVWSGLQAKMAAAGITAGTAAAAKGISVLAKWLIGGAAASAVAVTTVVLVNQAEKKEATEKTQVSAVNDRPEKSISTGTESLVAENNAETPTGTIASAQPVSPRNTDQEISFIAGTVPSLPINRPENGQTGEPQKNPFGSAEKPKATEVVTGPVAEPPVSDPKVSEPASKSRSKIINFPNFLTPNNDGDNDEMFVRSQYLSDFSVTFLNESSKVVWTSSDPDFKWDGNDMSGETLPAGNYICMIIAKGENGELIKEYKKVQLIR